MIKSRKRKNSRRRNKNKKQRISHKLVNKSTIVYYFVARRGWCCYCRFGFVWERVAGTGGEVFGRWAKSRATFVPQWQTTLTPTEKFTNRKVLFCNFQQTMSLVCVSCGAGGHIPGAVGVAGGSGIEPCRSEPAVCWASTGQNNAKWNWYKSFLIAKLNICLCLRERERADERKRGRTRARASEWDNKPGQRPAIQLARAQHNAQISQANSEVLVMSVCRLEMAAWRVVKQYR